jgi:hypothetical protein
MAHVLGEVVALAVGLHDVAEHDRVEGCRLDARAFERLTAGRDGELGG